MEHKDHVNLIKPAVRKPGTWAELGSGRGAFTLALAELLGPEGSIVSVDRDRRALAAQEKLAGEAGLQGTVKIGAYPSRFLREIYAALSIKPYPNQNTGL